MQISSIVLKNFRSFGPAPVTVTLTGLTAFVGPNGSGKTAVLQGLARLFGIHPSERTLQPEDFHLPPGRARDDVGPDEVLTLSIDVTLAFPELEADGVERDAVAECFHQMMVVEPGLPPICRVRLEGTWTRGNLPDGEVEQKLYWVRSRDPEPAAEHKHPMPGHDRSRIHVHYVPAAREPARQIRHVSGTILNRLFNAVEWSVGVREQVEEASEAIDTAFGAEEGVTAIEDAIDTCWRRLHDVTLYSGVHLRPAGRRLEEILKQVQAVFSPGPAGATDDLDRLSDGLKSLFYLAMVGATFELESRVARRDPALATHFSRDRLDPPALTVLAIEEPENHIAPHFLGRIVASLRSALLSRRGQVLLSSHSPSIMQRVEPIEVRHLRLDSASRSTLVNAIRLPAGESEAYKYVREAVRAFPELYFARAVVLGEGDSEEIIIPRVAAALGLEIDLSLVSVVPLGGRHVNHFWRLLTDLGIPHLTLLDLDRERHGGGWARVQYAIRELLACGVPREELLTTEGDLEAMPAWSLIPPDGLDSWLRMLEVRGVYFSAPLDLDFLMLRAFPDTYKTVAPGSRGPTMPAREDPARAAAVGAAVQAVLKPEGGDGATYSREEVDDFFWYRYLFLGRGKPVTHLRALTSLRDEDLAANAPPVLRHLIERLLGMLPATAEEGDDAA